MKFSLGENGMKTLEMTTKDLEYYVNIIDKTVAGLKRIDTDFERNSTAG